MEIKKNTKKALAAAVILALIVIFSPLGFAAANLEKDIKIEKEDTFSVFKDGNNEPTSNLKERIYNLSQKVAGLEHRLITDDKVRALALRDILIKKGVGKVVSLDEFIRFNNINEQEFNRLVQEAVDAMKYAQAYGLKAYSFFIESDFFNSKKYLDLAESQLKIYEEKMAEISRQIDSWKVPDTRHKDLEERIYNLSQKVAGLEHRLITDDRVRALTLKDILIRRGVGKVVSLDEFIRFNNINEQEFNRLVQEAVDAMKYAQAYGLKAYNFFLEKDFANAEKYLELAESQLKIYEEKMAEISRQIDSWKVPDTRHKDLEERIYNLSQKVAGLEHRLITDDRVRALTLRDILLRKGVGIIVDLDEFIRFNRINVEAFNQLVQEAVDAMKYAQAYGFKAYNFFLEKDFANAEKYLELAESQLKIYEEKMAEISRQIDSWKVPGGDFPKLQKKKLGTGIGEFDNEIKDDFNPEDLFKIEIQKVKTNEENKIRNSIEISENAAKISQKEKSIIDKIVEWFMRLFR